MGPISDALEHFDFFDFLDPLPPPCSNRHFARLRACRVLAGAGRANIRACPTLPGGSATSEAGGGAALAAVCGARKVADFATFGDFAENRDLRVAAPAECVHARVISTCGRALRTLEGAPST